MIIKGGMIASAPMGDPIASIPTPQPVALSFLCLVLLAKAAEPRQWTFVV